MERSLIVKLGAIGDIVMTVPAVYALHSEADTIDWLCGPAVAPLLRCYVWINAFVAEDRAALQGSVSECVRSVGSVWKMRAGAPLPTMALETIA